jgi:Flp pilus assembly protein TadB
MFTSKNLQETLEKAQEVLAEESREKKNTLLLGQMTRAPASILGISPG